MKILIDMNLSPKWEAVLVSHGMEAIHWSGVGLAYASDFAIMEYAAKFGFLILTSDLDFGIALAMKGARKPSVVQIRAEDLRPETQGEIVIRALRQMKEELERGALVTIEPKRTRLRILPMQQNQ
ncbi:MAG TPA: DUF5615 family PIN-like protein [Terracidiphilus sp.]